MAVGFSNTNKPINPRGNDASPLAFNRAKLFSGKALDFDGVNDYVSVADSDDLDGFTNFTLHAIVKADTFPNYCRIFDKNHTSAYNLAVNTSNKLYMYAKNTAFDFDYVVPTGEYVSIVVSFTGGSKVDLFINGQLEQTITTSLASISSNSFDLYIGRLYSGAGNPWDGQISNVKIFNTALTAAQVADLYNNPEKVVPTGVDNTALKLWLPMQEGAGTTAYDGSGNGNHGTISGATYTHGIGAPVSQTAVIDWNKGTNIFEHSEEFNDSYWTKARVNITANDISAPDGQTTADKALENSTTGYRDFGYRSISVTSGQPYTLSAYVKNGLGRDNAYFYTADGVRMAKFNIATGTYIGQASGNGYNAWDSYGITDAGNGWYRIHATLNSSSGGAKTYHLGFAENTDDVVAPYTGDTSKGLYAWGMQLENASSVGPYVRTGATAQTSEVLLPQGLTSGRDITGVNLFENVRKQGALNLDGNSWAEVHDNASLDITDAITLECWVYWDDASNKGILGRWHVDGSNRNYLFYKNSASTINFYINSSAIASYASLNATKGWTHIVGTYNRTNAVLYIDGVQQATTAHTPAISTGTLPVEIGRNFTTSNQALTAPIAQPRIYNRALTAEEVLRNYNSGKNTYTND